MHTAFSYAEVRESCYYALLVVKGLDWDKHTGFFVCICYGMR